MCNLCINSLTFLSRNLDKLKELHKLIKETTYDKNGNSIVALLDKHGYYTKDKMLLCSKRDYLSDCDTIITQKLDHYYFQAESCSAWTPNLLPIVTMLRERYGGEIKLIAQSEEEGMGIYHTNDVGSLFYNDKFKVDCCSRENYDTEYFPNWSNMIDFLQKEFPKANISYYDSINEIKDAIEESYSEDESFFFNLNMFTSYDDGESYSDYNRSLEAA